MDVILTGASRGIGRALAIALASPERRLILVARDRGRLGEVAAAVDRAGASQVVVGDLSTLRGASTLGETLRDVVSPGAMLIHCAGIWPSSRELGDDGLERAFVVNHLAPLAMQAPLVDAGSVARILVVSAGLLAFGRFDPARTPTGADFSAVRTYATTKLCFALAMRDFAEAHPAIDVLVMHPGVVRTDLGARGGVIGWLLDRVKRRWESPEACAARLARIVARERWSPAGEARWMMEDREAAWPRIADDARTRAAVREVTARLLERRRAA